MAYVQPHALLFIHDKQVISISALNNRKSKQTKKSNTSNYIIHIHPIIIQFPSHFYFIFVSKTPAIIPYSKLTCKKLTSSKIRSNYKYTLTGKSNMSKTW